MELSSKEQIYIFYKGTKPTKKVCRIIQAHRFTNYVAIIQKLKKSMLARQQISDEENANIIVDVITLMDFIIT